MNGAVQAGAALLQTQMHEDQVDDMRREAQQNTAVMGHSLEIQVRAGTLRTLAPVCRSCLVIKRSFGITHAFCAHCFTGSQDEIEHKRAAVF
jgi:hypothetical protein